MEEFELETIIFDAVTEIMGVDYKGKVNFDTKLVDMKIDSLDLLEIVTILEDELEVSFGDSIDFKTFGDLCNATIKCVVEQLF